MTRTQIALALSLCVGVGGCAVTPKASSSQSLDGSFANPIAASFDIGARFGPGQNPETSAWTMHSGVELIAQPGALVVAAQNGVAVMSGPWGGFAHAVRLRHANGFETLYAGLAIVRVEIGDVVERGSVIGAVGSGGSRDDGGLYFEIRRDGKPIDPLRASPQLLRHAKTP